MYIYICIYIHIKNHTVKQLLIKTLMNPVGSKTRQTFVEIIF